MKALIIKASGATRTVTYTDDNFYEVVGEVVGGASDPIDIFRSTLIMWIYTGDKISGVNAVAGEIYRRAYGWDTVPIGDVLITGQDDEHRASPYGLEQWRIAELKEFVSEVRDAVNA